MKKWWIMLLGLAMAGWVVAGEPAASNPEVDARMKDLKAKQMELGKKIDEARKRLNEDPEIAPLLKTMEEAKKAYDTKIREKMEADPAMAAMKKEMTELKKAMQELTAKPAEKKAEEKKAE